MDGRFDLSLPLDDTTFAVFDVETTGLSPELGDRVCEVACLCLRGGVEVGRFEALVDPARNISPGAYRVNRITADMVRGAPAFAHVAGRVLALMEGTAIVAHNAPFDLGFLASELDLAALPPPEGPIVDTLALCRRLYRFSSNSLPAVAAAMDIDAGPHHRAMGDVWTTGQVLERIRRDLAARYQVRTLGELLAVQGGSIPYPHRHAIALPPPIAEALERGGRVRMHYVNAGGQESHRVVRPLYVREGRDTLYLIAFCYKANEQRTFRLDRVVDMVVED